MGSKERILRLKEETRINILEGALDIVKNEGWQALSMRKIADKIEYTAPIIYEYFSNKEAILAELTRQGYCLLGKRMLDAKNSHTMPEAQLEAAWLAYWNFAFEEQQFYQLMFGVEMNCCALQETMPDGLAPYDIIAGPIMELMQESDPESDAVCTKYYTYWSIIHGLISLNLVRRNVSDDINMQVLRDAITGITGTLKPAT
jgi:AcrR family transcriptional regulator